MLSPAAIVQADQVVNALEISCQFWDDVIFSAFS